MGGVENELACTMHQYINEDGWKLKKLADEFDEIGPQFLLGLAPEEVTEEDSATANIIRIEYMNEGNTLISHNFFWLDYKVVMRSDKLLNPHLFD